MFRPVAVVAGPGLRLRSLLAAALFAATVLGPLSPPAALAAAPASAAPVAAPSAAAPPPAAFAGPVFCTRIYLDGQRIVLPVPAVVAGGRTLVPARAVFERLGATVLWNGADRVTIKTADRTIDLYIGSALADVDGRPLTLDAPAVLWRSRVMVPLRFAAENLGLDVAWDDTRRAVLLSRRSEGGEGAPVRDITLAFAGDTLLGSRVGDLIDAKGADYPWGGVAPTLARADIAMVNLECCVSTRGTPYDKTWTFRARPSSLDGLVHAGVDIVSLANNHSEDYGSDALLDTIAYLDQRGVAHVGAGANKDEAWRPVVLEAGGYKVGFLAGTVFYPEEWTPTAQRPGICSARDIGALAAAVAKLREQVDYVVVSLHWGVEGDSNPDAFQRRCGRALIDAGADLVIGHHPHVLQGIEVYKGKAIVYSLGNFVFTHSSRRSQDSGIVLATFDEEGLAALRFLPVFTDDCRPVLETGEDYERMLADMNTLSAEWGTTLDPSGFVLLP